MMRWEFDTEMGSLYVHLADGVVDRQVEMPDGVVVDLAGDRVIGVEVLSAWAPYNLKSVAERFELSRAEEEALSFLSLTLRNEIHPRRDRQTMVEVASPTSSRVPAQLFPVG